MSRTNAKSRNTADFDALLGSGKPLAAAAPAAAAAAIAADASKEKEDVANGAAASAAAGSQDMDDDDASYDSASDAEGESGAAGANGAAGGGAVKRKRPANRVAGGPSGGAGGKKSRRRHVPGAYVYGRVVDKLKSAFALLKEECEKQDEGATAFVYRSMLGDVGTFYTEFRGRFDIIASPADIAAVTKK
jgi:hypothetical protein